MKQESTFDASLKLTFDTVSLEARRLTTLVSSLNTEILTLNLSEVRTCDSAGIALLIEAKRLCEQNSKQCHIVGMSNTIQSLAKFCGVDKLLYNGTQDL